MSDEKNAAQSKEELEQKFTEAIELLKEARKGFLPPGTGDLWRTKEVRPELALQLRETLALFSQPSKEWYEEGDIPKIPAPREEQDFKNLDRTARFALVQRAFMKGTDMGAAARLINWDPAELRKEYGIAMSEGRAPDTESELKKWWHIDYIEAENFNHTVGNNAARNICPSVATVKNWERSRLSPGEIAKKLDVDLVEFQRWRDLNEDWFKVI